MKLMGIPLTAKLNLHMFEMVLSVFVTHQIKIFELLSFSRKKYYCRSQTTALPPNCLLLLFLNIFPNKRGVFVHSCTSSCFSYLFSSHSSFPYKDLAPDRSVWSAKCYPNIYFLQLIKSHTLQTLLEKS